jgi:hypothetical protein
MVTTMDMKTCETQLMTPLPCKAVQKSRSFEQRNGDHDGDESM